MKIKLSKSQWSFIGKQTGWLKLAQSVPPPDPQKQRKILQTIFDSLPGHTNQMSTYAKELPFNDTMGDAYIATNLNQDKTSIHIEKYYENEMAQDEYGEVKNIPIQWDNPTLTITTLLNIINVWLGTDKIKSTRII